MGVCCAARYRRKQGKRHRKESSLSITWHRRHQMTPPTLEMENLLPQPFKILEQSSWSLRVLLLLTLSLALPSSNLQLPSSRIHPTVAAMKFLSAAALLLATPLVSAASLKSFFDPSQAPIQVDTTEDFPVTGDNPLVYCDNPANHVLQIESVDLLPNPPQP